MIVKIKKLSDNPNQSVDEAGFKEGRLGYIHYAPVVGEGLFTFTTEDEDSIGIRTTVVREIEPKIEGDKLKWICKTMNSTYEVEKISD